MQFDLISDLHLDLWKNNIKDWRGLGTSLICVVAGDVSRDPRLTVSFLKHLSESYKHVIFVDGNHEHFRKYHDLETSVIDLERQLSKIKNITYLADSSTIIDGTAFIGSNGWWTFDFPELNGGPGRLMAMEAFCQKEKWNMRDAVNIWSAAQEQAEFLCDVVSSLQNNDDIGEIVVITHTVPRHDLSSLSQGGDLVDWAKMGNSSMKQVLDNDPEGKISAWCYGHDHYHPGDQVIDGVRYISHPRGRPEDSMISSYFPKMVNTATDVIVSR